MSGEEASRCANNCIHEFQFAHQRMREVPKILPIRL